MKIDHSQYNRAMSAPIVTTKLYIPPLRPNSVVRPRLLARLNDGLHHKLTLISAPAGFGKTTLASAWLARCGRPAAWLSLDSADNDPNRFLAYLIAALQAIAPTIGVDVMGLLQSSQPPTIDTLLPTLLNEIATMPQPAILVLDDYHLLDAAPIDQALAFLVEHLPPALHLVIVTREDPQLPMARLRARGHLTELRAADLRFTPTEATTFLAEVMHLDLSPADIAALEARTEGWITGLQLAALSMQGQQDTSGFIRAFAGDHRYILDYLVDEVLQRQPAATRSFLLQTSILERLYGPLCDAVTGQAGGSMRLEALHRGNFFVIPLDDTRHWYRYHHLFAEVLVAHLRAEQPDDIALLHQRASAWYEQHNLVADAIRHAFAAEDFVHAANLIERVWQALRQSRQDATLLGWLSAIPGQVLDHRPTLSVAYAHVLLANGVFEGVEERLRAAEQCLNTQAAERAKSGDPATEAERSTGDTAASHQLPGTIAIARAGLALARGDVPATVTYAQQAFDLAPADEYLLRGAANGFLGLAAWARGDLAAAHDIFAQGMAMLQQAGNIADVINGTITLATIRMAQGHLRDAMRTYERGLQLATAYGDSAPRGTADLYVGMSELMLEQGNLQAAMQLLQQSTNLGEHAGFPQNRYRWHVAMARIHEVEGALDSALTQLDEAEHLYMSDFSPNVRPIAALRVRVWIAQGRLAEALSWAREQGLSIQDSPSFLREFEHITLARVLLAHAQHQRDERSLSEVASLLERLERAAEAGERTGSLIEILLVEALVYQAQGNLAAALRPLARALALAAPEGYTQSIIREGPAMAELLIKMAGGHPKEYIHRLLAAFGEHEYEHASPSIAQPLVEPLSERELDVLRLLRTELSGPEIARRLMVSLNTIRTHTRNIYDKLGVTNRLAAIRRADELELF